MRNDSLDSMSAPNTTPTNQGADVAHLANPTAPRPITTGSVPPQPVGPSASVANVALNQSSAPNMPDPLDMPRGSVVEPMAARPFGPSAPGAATSPVTAVTSRPDPVPLTVVRDKAANRSLVETIVLVLVSIVAVVFIGLFAWKYIEWDAVKTDVDGQIDSAVAMAKAELRTEMENEFTEREKYPYKTFTGPADYGSLSFEYPKTWNVYIAKDAQNGGDFEAYFNPGEVQTVSSTTINALRVTIKDQAFDTAVRSYDNSVNSGKLTLTTRLIGGTIANVYTGELMNKLYGVMAAFKLRDKTVILQTDANIFSDEFYRLLDTVTFVE